MPVLPRAAALPVLLAAALLPLTSPAPATAEQPPQQLSRFVPSDRRVELRGSGETAESLVAARRSALRADGGGAATSTFVVRYSGFTTAQRDAFQAAVDTWSRLVSSPVPIRIDARIASLPPGVLGAAGPTGFVVEDANGRYDAEDTLVPIALANALEGADLAPDDPDIDAEFSSDSRLFSYGVDPEPGRYDFTTVVLHEIGHGLGFAGAMEVLTDEAGVERGYWNPGTTQPRPLVFDRLTATPNADGTLTPLLSLPRGSTALAEALTRGRSVWTGPAGTAANDGRPVELFTPPDWQPGSSYSHVDEEVYPTGHPDSLMTPVIDQGEVVRDPGDIALAMLADMGWVAETDPVRLTGPSSAPAGARVPVAGVAAPGATVQVYFRRRGQTATSPGALPGYTLQRTLTAGPDGAFATSYVNTDDHRYYAKVGSDASDPVLTQLRPTISGASTRRVPRGSTVSVAGRSLPGTALRLRFTRGGALVAERTVTVSGDGSWFRNQTLTQDLRVHAVAANGQRSDQTVLLQVR